MPHGDIFGFAPPLVVSDGCSVFSGSMTGLIFFHDHMNLPVPGVLHTGDPHYYWEAQPGETEEDSSRRRAAELEQLILQEGSETVGAFIAEPVLGTGGIVLPPAGYWREIQAVLQRHDVLLIADEVIYGFGRTGADFGSVLYDMEPDLVTIAKGLTSGYAPLSGAIVGEKIYAVMEEAADRIGVCSHGYT
jgi:L-2,4-diaminobutyrate transaminase